MFNLTMYKRIQQPAILLTISLLLAGCATQSTGTQGYDALMNPLPPGTPTPQEQLAQLRADPTVEVWQERGWTMAYSEELETTWRFTLETHPAYPSVIRSEAALGQHTNETLNHIQCCAGKEPCEKWIRSIIEHTERKRES